MGYYVYYYLLLWIQIRIHFPSWIRIRIRNADSKINSDQIHFFTFKQSFLFFRYGTDAVQLQFFLRWIRIRIEKKNWIRIRKKSMRIHSAAENFLSSASFMLVRC